MRSVLFPTIVLLPSLVSANIGISWSIADVPSSGLKDITFPIAMPNVKHETGLYFAQQYGFVGADSVGYTGLQPRPDGPSGSVVHAVFSSFIAGTTSTDTEYCSDGADGGAGVSCAVEITAPYSHTYNLVVENTHGTTWTGTLVDAVLGNSTHIGTYTLPAGTGGIQSSQVGFLEYYLFNVANADKNGECGTMPRADVTFGPPTTTTSDSGVGELGEPWAYGGCEEESNFKSTPVEGGAYRVTVGFV